MKSSPLEIRHRKAELFVDHFLNRFTDWMEHSRQAWIEAGSPAQFDPELIISQPAAYTTSVYTWCEEHYNQFYQPVYDAIKPSGELIKAQPAYFIQRWSIHYDPITIWKQLLPLFIFARALDGIRQDHIEAAKAYAVGKAIPSMVVDSMLDTTYEEKQDWLLCLTAYALGLDIFHKLPGAGRKIEQIFLSYTKQMYFSMWREKRSQYTLPEAVHSSDLLKYLHGESRLLSSVFFGSTIEMAFALADKELPATFPDALLALRRVRQLNDELVDIDEDVQQGILTYPYLHCLSSPLWGQPLAENIRATWRTEVVPANKEKLSTLTRERRTLLQQADSYMVTALASATLLIGAYEKILDYFPISKAFEITLLLNQRLSHLSRLEQRQWHATLNVYQPDPFSFLPAIDNISTSC